MKTKRLTALLLMFCMVLCMLPATRTHAATIAEGICGPNLTWTLDDAGTLTVSGTGHMYDYTSHVGYVTDNRPWEQYRDLIQTVRIGDGVTTVTRYSFAYLDNLTTVQLGNSLTTIDTAFAGCDKLTTVTIPASVTDLSSAAFQECASLTGIWVDPNNPNYSSDDRGVLFNKNKTELLTAPGGLSGHYTIPEGVTSISQAFRVCEKLTSVTIPSSVTVMPFAAFSTCSGLTAVTLSDSGTEVAWNAFIFCEKLTDIHIVDEDDWFDISQLGRILCENDLPKNLYLNGELVTDLVIPEGTTVIPDYGFYHCNNLTNVTIPDGVTSIGYNAFVGCGNLTGITIPGSVTKISNYAFKDCLGLTTVTLQEGVSRIGRYAFEDCNNLTSITIPASLTHIDDGAFMWCNELTDIYIADVGAWCEIIVEKNALNGYSPLFPKNNKPTNLYLNGTLVTDLVIPEGTKTVAPYAFANCTQITSVTVPGSVTQIGENAFSGCSNLENVVYTGNAEQGGQLQVADGNTMLFCKESGNPPTGHNWKEATCVTPKTCAACGETVGNAKYHEWTLPTCTDPYICNICGATQGWAHGHDWKDATCTVPKTCTVCGTTEGTPEGHIYNDNVDGTCNGCGADRAELDASMRQVVHMFRMYNPNTGEHFYTGSEVEKNNLVVAGWKYEGVGFTFPANTGDPVHRLFQPSTGEHLYTMDVAEKDKLMAEGWNYEGIAFNSAYDTEAVQHRLHNPNAEVGAYHFTFSEEEMQNLIAAGWEYQGIGWYSCWK